MQRRWRVSSQYGQSTLKYWPPSTREGIRSLVASMSTPTSPCPCSPRSPTRGNRGNKGTSEVSLFLVPSKVFPLRSPSCIAGERGPTSFHSRGSPPKDRARNHD